MDRKYKPANEVEYPLGFEVCQAGMCWETENWWRVTILICWMILPMKKAYSCVQNASMLNQARFLIPLELLILTKSIDSDPIDPPLIRLS